MRLGAIKRELYWILEAGVTPDWASRLFDAFMVVLIVANVAAVAAETVPSLHARYAHQFARFDTISVATFTVEYLLRLWVCTEHRPLARFGPLEARIRFALTPYAVIDLLAILPFYLALPFPADLRALRALRLLRLLKLARYSPALDTIGRVLRTEWRALLGSVLIMLIILLFASTLAYYAEREAQPEKFGSIPAAMWWAMATLTTVGYGDYVPVTLLGKITGGVVMLSGVAMFALPIGIIATGFAQEIHRREFVVSWGMVARVPLFSELRPTAFMEIAGLLRAQRLAAGTVVARKDEPADCMYFVANGELEADFEEGHPPLRIGEGEHFGEIALLRDARRTATIRARRASELMVLGAHDFHRLLERHPSIRARVMEVAARRLAEIDSTDVVDSAKGA